MAPSEITDALHQLEAELTRIDAPILEHLKPGLPRGQIEKLLGEATTVNLHPDLVSWYSWTDGTSLPHQSDGRYGVPRVSDQQLVAQWYVMALSQAISFHNRYHAEVREEYGFPDWYRDGWFPILQDLGGGVICIDTTGDGALYIVDVHMDLPRDPPEPQSPNLLHFVSTYVTLLKAGIVHMSAEQEEQTTDYGNLPADLPGKASYW